MNNCRGSARSTPDILIRRALLAGLLALLWHCPPGLALAEPLATDLTACPGTELVQQLLVPATRLPALYELCRRNGRGKTDYAAFLADFYEPEVIVCPQNNGQMPLYLVLYGRPDRYQTHLPDAYIVSNPQELFPLLAEQGSLRRPVLVFFTAAGRVCQPFGGNNMLTEHGVIADINGDGLIERADSMRYHVEGIRNASVLTVSTISDTPVPLLDVLFNWESDDWHYRIADTDSDGLSEIIFGPTTPSGLAGKVVYRWDSAQQRYVGPAGTASDHYRQIQHRENSTLGAELRGLRDAGLTFPQTSEEPQGMGRWTFDRFGGATLPTELTHPYHYASLRDLSDSELVAYMRAGKNLQHLERELVQTRLPNGFWDMPPDSAALALAEINRSPNHRQHFWLALDGRDGAQPPEKCSIIFNCQLGNCIFRLPAEHYFLQVDPDNSYLAFARNDNDLRLVSVPYAAARHIARTIWWLDRVRSYDFISRNGTGMSIGSTGDGHDMLVMRDDAGQVLLNLSAKRWDRDPIPQRFLGEYERQTCINLADYLLTKVLPEYLGEEWKKQEWKLWAGVFEGDTVRYVNAAAARLPVFARDFLGKYSPDERLISNIIVTAAAMAAGRCGYRDMAPVLQRIQSTIPPRTTPLRRADEIISAINRMSYDDADTRAQLYREYDDASHYSGEYSVEQLRQAVDEALKKLAAASDTATVAAATAKPVDTAASSSSVPDSRYFVPATIAAIADPPQKMRALINFIRDTSNNESARFRAIEMLVPADTPLLYPDREVDRTLVQLFDRKNQPASHISQFVWAIAMRGHPEYYPVLDGLLVPQDSVATQELVRKELTRTNQQIVKPLILIWTTDMREMLPELERLATSCPEDYEGEKAYSSGGEVSPVTGRFHLARKIAALWKEEDILTRTKLLIAFGLEDAYYFMPGAGSPERIARIRLELARVKTELSPAQMASLVDFIDWYNQALVASERVIVYRERRQQFMQFARTALGLTSCMPDIRAADLN